MSTKIELISKNKKLKNPVVFIGLPGIGLVGKITVDYLVNELTPKPKEYAIITSDSFPPAVHTKNSILSIIKDNVLLYSTKDRDYLFLVGPIQPILSNSFNYDQHYEFSESILDFLKKQEVKEIYTFAGLNIGNKRIDTKKPKVIAVVTDDKTKKNMEKKKIKNLFFNNDNKDTLISGVAGILPGLAYYKYKIPGICIMGETNSKLSFGDHASAKEVLEVIISIFNLKINLKKIDNSAKKIEKSFNEITKNIEEISKKDIEENNSKYIR
jgi:hypothetical protein